MAFDTGTLTGTYELIDGTSDVGTVEITPSVNRVRDAGGNVVISGSVTRTLDVDGSFTVDLPATDDDTLNPAGVTYTLVTHLAGSNVPAIVGIGIPAGDTVLVAEVDAGMGTAPVYAQQVARTEFNALDERVEALEENPGGGGVEPSLIYYYQSGIARFGVNQPGPSGAFVYVDWTGDDSIYNEDVENPILTVNGDGDLVIERAGLYGVMVTGEYTATGAGSALTGYVGVSAVANGSVINELRLYPFGYDADATVNLTAIGRKMFSGSTSPFVPLEQVFETTVAFTEGQVVRFRTNFTADGIAQAGSVSFGLDLRVIALF